jgi:hypothetical protein
MADLPGLKDKNEQRQICLIIAVRIYYDRGITKYSNLVLDLELRSSLF